MATQLFANNAASLLASGITNVATSLSVTAGAGVKFPSPTGGDYFKGTLCQLSGVDEVNFEVVKVTAKATDAFTIVRAQEGTTALAFNAGDKFELRITKGTLETFALNSIDNINNIGIQGAAGFGVGICPALPAGFVAMSGYDQVGTENYGNYQYADGSIMVWIPAFFYKYGTGSNGLSVNIVDIKPESAFASVAAANTAGYALHRAFYDGGAVQRGVFVDKYKCSANAGIASSIKNGIPLSSNATNTPWSALVNATGTVAASSASTTLNFTAVTSGILAVGQRVNAAGVTAGTYISAMGTSTGGVGTVILSAAMTATGGAATTSPGEFYYGAIAAAKTRGTNFFSGSVFIRGALALLALAHAQASTSTTWCAWYHATNNFPKGCNNNALGDQNDAALLFVTSGYSTANKTGSANVLAKTTHNGQNCGVADVNGTLWEVCLGITSDATNFYVLKTSATMKNITAGNAAATDAWGATGIAALYDSLGATYGALTVSSTAKTYGSATQVFDAATSGNAWNAAGAGIPLVGGVGGTNAFGNDGLWDYRPNELCPIAAGDWGGAASAGAWALYLSTVRGTSYANVGLRAALYL